VITKSYLQTKALGRRPSKISSAERLSRPSPPPSPRGPSSRPSSSQSNTSNSGRTPLSLPQASSGDHTPPLNLSRRQQPAPAPDAGSAGPYPSSPPLTPPRPQQRYGQSNNVHSAHSPPYQSSHLPPSPRLRLNDKSLAPPSEYGFVYYDPLHSIDTVPASVSSDAPTSVSTVPLSLRPGAGIPYLDPIPTPAAQPQAEPSPASVAAMPPQHVDPPAYASILPPRQPQRHHESEALGAQRLALEERDRRRRQEEEDEALARQLMLEEEENERRERDHADPNIRNYATSQGNGRRLPGSWRDE
jgi:hypothetical protein